METMEPPVENSVGARTLAERLQSGQTARILDVRTPGEFKGGHIAGARLVPLADLRPEELCGQLNPDARIYVLCQSGARARKAIDRLTAAGFDSCVLLEGGMDAWEAAGLPVERESTSGISILRQ